MRFVDLLDPVLEVVKGLAVGDAVDQNDSCCSLVVGFGDCFESFLTGRVPDLHFDFDAIDIDGFDFEVDADSGHVAHLILLVDVTQKDVGLANGRVSDDDQFHQVVVLLFVSSLSHNNYKLTEIVNIYQSILPKPQTNFKISAVLWKWIGNRIRYLRLLKVSSSHCLPISKAKLVFGW